MTSHLHEHAQQRIVTERGPICPPAGRVSVAVPLYKTCCKLNGRLLATAVDTCCMCAHVVQPLRLLSTLAVCRSGSILATAVAACCMRKKWSNPCDCCGRLLYANDAQNLATRVTLCRMQKLPKPSQVLFPVTACCMHKWSNTAVGVGPKPLQLLLTLAVCKSFPNPCNCCYRLLYRAQVAHTLATAVTVCCVHK